MRLNLEARQVQGCCPTQGSLSHSHFQHYLTTLRFSVSFLHGGWMTEQGNDSERASYIYGHVLLVRVFDGWVIALNPLIMYELCY